MTNLGPKMCSLLVVAAATVACSPSGPANIDWTQQQRDSLDVVFYRDNARPPMPTAQELQLARDKIQAAEPWERELLQALYPEDEELITLAIRDSDADGIFDFRISDYYGRFMEGDTDLDGDGLDNVLDATPFDSSTEIIAHNGIPPHVDWAQQGKPSDMVRIQKELFDRHRILLVERSADFTPQLALSVYDVVTRVYRGVFADNGALSTLRIIATEETPLLDPEDEEGSGDFAQVLAATQTMEVYRRGIDALPVIQLGFLAHEIGHNIQFSMDYDAQRQDEIIRRNYFAATRFHHLVAQYGWTLTQVDPDPQAEFTLFRPQYISPDAYEYLFQEETVEEWETWLSEIYDEVGEEAYLTDERITELNILGDYSLSGPWEWYSDHVIAYLYLAMLDSLQDKCSPSDWEALRAAFQDEIITTEWPYFRFENARGADVQIHLGQAYPMDSDDVKHLAETYLLGSQPQYCTIG